MRRQALCLAAAAALFASPVAAQQYMQNTPEAMLAVASIFGTAQIEPPDSGGRPIITGRIDGTNYGLLIYGCEGTVGCDSVQFFATFESQVNSLEFLNEWNEDQRFATAYRDSRGDVVIHYNANIDFGVSPTNFEDTFDIWRLTLGNFVERLNDRGECFGNACGSGGGSGK